MAGLAVDIGEAAVKSSYIRSMGRVLMDSPVGASLEGFLKEKVEPSIGRAAQMKMGTGMAPDMAMSEATKEVHTMAFGNRKQGIIPILQAAQRQKGSVHASEMANALDIYFKDQNSYWRDAARTKGVDISRKSIYEPKTGLIENTLRKYSGVWFLPRIAIPHAFQAPLNSLIVDGWASTAKAFKDLVVDKKTAFDLSLRAGALSQELMYEFKQAQQGTTTLNKLLNPLRSVFSLERKYGIVFSGVAGKHAAIDAADNLLATKGASERAKVQLRVLGIDPTEVLKQGGLSAEHIDSAVYRSAAEVMGFRSPLETPYRWEQNGAMRIATVYKHFGFRQGMLIKDAMKRAYAGEGWAGPAKLAATIGSTFFVSGELIKGLEGMALGHNPWGEGESKNNLMSSEFIDGVAHAGAFGIFYQGLRSARGNRLANFVEGPYISSATDIAQDVYNKRGKAVGRDIMRKLGLPGSFLANTVLKPDHRR